MSVKIEPTVGRIVWFRPHKTDALALRGEQPLAAIIAHVNSNNSLNLTVFGLDGHPHSKTSVQLVQDGDSAPSDSSYAEWMPYQKGQAAKTEQVQQQYEAINKDGSISPVVPIEPLDTLAEQPGSSETNTLTSTPEIEKLPMAPTPPVGDPAAPIAPFPGVPTPTTPIVPSAPVQPAPQA